MQNDGSVVTNHKTKVPLSTDRARFDIQQKALKLVTNSMYCVFGFISVVSIASLITGLGLKVIYGDTDSTLTIWCARAFANLLENVPRIGLKLNYSWVEVFCNAI